MLDWQWKRFEELTLEELYALLALRTEVFVVEQRSIYLDADGYDMRSLHLLGRTPDDTRLAAYLRVLPPGLKYPEPSIGRVVTAPWARRQGLGRELFGQGVAYLDAHYPDFPIRIGAQAYLQRFYEGFGFAREGDVYDEDGIPHIDMRRSRART